MRNKISLDNLPSSRISYWQIFRLIFVILFLYLLGDVFFRWDGFRYYATFSDYISSVALVTVLWFIVAAFIALIIWLFLIVINLTFSKIGWVVRIEHMLNSGANHTFSLAFYYLGCSRCSHCSVSHLGKAK